jgi:hypothetical protein
MASGSILQFPLRLGLAEDSNPKAQPVSSLKSGVNIRWPREGVIGKRLGSDVMPTAIAGDLGDLIGLKRLVVRGSELSVTDGTRLYTYDDTNEQWIQGPKVCEFALSWRSLTDTTAGVATSDVAMSGDLLVHAWVTGDPTRTPEATPVPATSGVGWVQVVDRSSGKIRMLPTKLVIGADEIIVHVRVLVLGDYAFVIYSIADVEAGEDGGGNGTIYVQAIGLTGVVSFSGSEVTLVSDVVGTDANGIVGRFDACALSSEQHLVLVYEKDTDGDSLISSVLYTVDGDSIALDTSNDVPETSTYINFISLSIVEDPNNDRVWILYGHRNGTGVDGEYTTSDFRIRVMAVSNSTLTPYDLPGGGGPVYAVTVDDNVYAEHVDVCVPPIGWTGAVCVAWTCADGSGSDSYSTTAQLDIDGDELSGLRRRSISIGLLSKMFQAVDRLYFFAADLRYGIGPPAVDERLEWVPSPSSYLLEIEADETGSDLPPHRYVGKVDHAIAGAFMQGLLPQVGAAGVEAFGIVPYQATAAPLSYNWRDGIRLVHVESLSNSADPLRSVCIGDEAYISGARLSAWDGQICFDAGIRTTRLVELDSGAGSTGNMSMGAYIYQASPEFRSRAGVLHRGPASTQQTVTANADGSVGVFISPHSIDCKQTLVTGYGSAGSYNISVPVYRTEANGSILYRLTAEPRFNVVENDPLDEYMSLTDTASDSDITSAFSGEDVPPVPDLALANQAQHYTATGELEDVQPPAQYTIHFHGNRVGIITGGRREYWYSKDIRENPGIAPGFNPVQVELYETDLVAAATMDEKRVMFAERKIWFVVGDGPNVSGTDNRFTPPQAIQTDVGCTNPRSVVSTPLGIMFQSDTDLFLLDRGLTVSWIGRDVKDTLAAFPVITSAVLVSAENEVRFTCNSANELFGRMLVFDYERKVWMTRVYSGGEAIVDACLFEGTYYMAMFASVRHELADSHLDDGTFVSSTVNLAPISPSGPLSWQRVRRAQVLGTSLSNHQMVISIARDFSETTQQTKTFAAGSDTTTVGPLERAQVDLAVQKIQAVEIHISDAEPEDANTHPLGNGGGFTLDGVALLIQPKSGLPRITPSRRG